MGTLRSELIKNQTLINNLRQLSDKKEFTMPTQTVINSRTTGGKNANKRFKRTPEELDADIEKVDQLVASGKFNQIEALNHVGLQSSVYHYRKRNAKEAVAKSIKPRKSANRTVTKDNYQEMKEQILAKPEVKEVPEVADLKQFMKDFETMKAKYNQIMEILSK